MTTSLPNEVTRYRARYLVHHCDVIENGAILVENGRIKGVETATTPASNDEKNIREVDLGHVALVPGLVNAHSHAFQRAIRGHTEYLRKDRPDDDFWSWRNKMYDAALSFTPGQIHAVARLAFLEMALSGITTVGEFHYVHHQQDGTPYDDPNELAHRVIDAAKTVGIRINLLRVAYNRAGFNKPHDPLQRRFVETDVDTYLTRLDALRRHYSGEDTVTVGLAPHSIRAIPHTWFKNIATYASQHDLVTHIHACEQRLELKQSHEEYGKTPIALLDDEGLLGERLTLVHGTHLSPDDYRRLASKKPTVCACPTTERNLGDGFLPALSLSKAGIPIALGSDSHTVIDLWEEMRLVEYHERLRMEQRNVLAPFATTHENERTLQTAKMLWPMSTTHGARALGLPTGDFSSGNLADFVALDLDHISLIGTNASTLLSDITLSMPPAAVRDVFVHGKQFIENGRHALQDEIIDTYRRAVHDSF